MGPDAPVCLVCLPLTIIAHWLGRCTVLRLGPVKNSVPLSISHTIAPLACVDISIRACQPAIAMPQTAQHVSLQNLALSSREA